MADTLCGCQFFHSEHKTRILVLACLLECVSHDIADGRDLLCLPNSVHAVKSLILDHGVPLRLHEEDVICSRQVKP